MFDISPMLGQPFGVFVTAKNSSEYDKEIEELLSKMKHKREEGYPFTYELQGVIRDFAQKHKISPIARASDLFYPILKKHFG